MAKEGLTILAAEKALNDKYEISGSPTILINEKKFESAIDSQAYKDGICNGFKKQPNSCSQKLSVTNTQAAASGSCN
jgi:hypothetical protein